MRGRRSWNRMLAAPVPGGTQVHVAKCTPCTRSPCLLAPTHLVATAPHAAALLTCALRQPCPSTPCNPWYELCPLQFAGKAATLWQSGQCCDRRMQRSGGRARADSSVVFPRSQLPSVVRCGLFVGCMSLIVPAAGDLLCFAIASRVCTCNTCHRTSQW